MDVSYTGLKGEELAFVNEYDAVLLDLNLPDKDGLDILKFLRSSNVTAPVIIVTAQGTKLRIGRWGSISVRTTT